ncbi:hypothetical protein VN97_g12406, partial [Penicillium thymicola]
ELVVGWVTTSESSLLYVFLFLFLTSLYRVQIITYDHRVWKIGLPVRSAVLKPHAGELVVGWVTTSESSLLYVFVCCSYNVSHYRAGHTTEPATAKHIVNGIYPTLYLVGDHVIDM